jgi:OOP family OmpA-OmpF porin
MKGYGFWAMLAVLPLAAACSTEASNAAAQPVAAAPEPPTAAGASAAGKPSDESLTIAFPPALATLSPTALAQLDSAARLYRDAKPEVMIVAGHSDPTGQEYDNLILSAKRAAAVKEGLVDRGLPADRLQIVAIGAAEPVPSIPASRTAIVTWR